MERKGGGPGQIKQPQIMRMSVDTVSDDVALPRKGRERPEGGEWGRERRRGEGDLKKTGERAGQQ